MKKKFIYSAYISRHFLLLKKVIKIKEIRCPNCNQLLLRANTVTGEIKCTRCKKIIKLDFNKTERATP